MVAPVTGQPGRKSRKKTLANGKLRPAVRRAKQKRSRRERAAWLAQFAPGARDHFFKYADADQAVWLRGFERVTGVDRETAAGLLERTANERGWMKLRTSNCTVVGIAPPRAKDTTPAALAKMTDRQLEDSVAAFCDEDLPRCGFQGCTNAAGETKVRGLVDEETVELAICDGHARLVTRGTLDAVSFCGAEFTPATEAS